MTLLNIFVQYVIQYMQNYIAYLGLLLEMRKDISRERDGSKIPYA